MAQMGLTYGRRTRTTKTLGGQKAVAEAWAQGVPRDHAHLKTDGRDIFIGQIKLGWTDEGGRKVAVRYIGDNAISREVTRAVKDAMSRADAVYEPGRESVRRWRKIYGCTD